MLRSAPFAFIVSSMAMLVLMYTTLLRMRAAQPALRARPPSPRWAREDWDDTVLLPMEPLPTNLFGGQ